MQKAANTAQTFTFLPLHQLSICIQTCHASQQYFLTSHFMGSKAKIGLAAVLESIPGLFVSLY